MAGKDRILVLGPTGAIGRHIVWASVKAGNPTYVLVRDTPENVNKPRLVTAANPETRDELLQNFQNSGVFLIQGDMNDHQSLVNAIKQVDVVICSFGRLLIEDQVKIIAAIKEAGNVKRFFPSEFGLDVDRHDSVEPVREVFEEKAKIRRVIEAEGVPYTYLCCHAFTGYFLRNLAQIDITVPPRDKIFIQGDGNVKGAYVTEADVGTFTIEAANDPCDIQHKNLVKLLGCSITGPESLLVYEYVPNQSLHDHLSVRRISHPLSWEFRHKIILGIAEGLSYLHEESHVRIIHRDIKLSNILLEEDFTPKIADFGLARLFPEDKSHISTAIAGTLGYMAPEYVIRGKLSEKADVYSFGVLVIEIVSGKRNSSFIMNSSSLLQTVWSLYGLNRLSEVVDPTFEGPFPAEEACRLLQIGLLCAQASAELRPSMSVVVKMVNHNHEIPQPTQPPFIHSGSSELSRSGLPGYNFQPGSNTQSSANTMTESLVEPR